MFFIKFVKKMMNLNKIYFLICLSWKRKKKYETIISNEKFIKPYLSLKGNSCIFSKRNTLSNFILILQIEFLKTVSILLKQIMYLKK